MSYWPVVWVVASAALHAAWNALIKREAEPRLAGFALFAATAVFALVPALWSGRWFPGGDGLPWALAAGACEAVYLVALIRALTVAPLGGAYAIARGASLLVVWPLAILWQHEAVRGPAIAGAALIALGVSAVGLRSRTPRAGLGWALVCALGIGGFNLFYKQAIALHSDEAALFTVSMAVAVPVNGMLMGRPLRDVLPYARRRWMPVLLGSLTCLGSFLLFLYAMRYAGAGWTSTLRNTSVLFAQVFALGLGERPGRTQGLGAVAICAGAALLVVG